MAGRIYCGDNLEVLSLPEFFQPEMVDLVYADPPFNSQRTYNIVYKESNAQKEAFKDYWTWTEAAPMYARLMGDSTLLPRSLKPLLESLHARLVAEDDDLLAYLTMMTPRLVAMHRTLKKTGSLYLHCDPTASHYLKIVLDAIFGSRNFRSEIIWKRSAAHSDTKQGRAIHGHIHDTLLFYTKSDVWTWNPIYTPYDDSYVNRDYRLVDEAGRRFRRDNLTAAKPGGDVEYTWRVKRHRGVRERWVADLTDEHKDPLADWEYKGVKPYTGRYWAYSIENMRQYAREGRLRHTFDGMPEYKRFLDEMPGVTLQDVWTDIQPTSPKERLGYPTQKPIILLDRIIRSSTSHGDIVLDPFCGCGTTVEACERLGRRWFGIDIAKRAVDVIDKRFVAVGLPKPEIVWQPADKDAAHALGEADKHGFEKWALRKIRAARLRTKDRGIDGEALFKDGDVSYPVIVSVKAGGVKPGDVRDLRGTIGREDETLLDDGRSFAMKRTIGVFVSRKEPSDEMKLEATRAGFLPVSDGEGQIPRIQFVNVERLFGPLPPIRCPGKNVTEMPKPTIPPPPVVGEQLGLDIDHKVKDAKPATAKAKLRGEPPPKVQKPGGAAKAKPYEPEVKVATGSDSEPPPSPRRRR